MTGINLVTGLTGLTWWLEDWDQLSDWSDWSDLVTEGLKTWHSLSDWGYWVDWVTEDLDSLSYWSDWFHTSRHPRPLSGSSKFRKNVGLLMLWILSRHMHYLKSLWKPSSPTSITFGSECNLHYSSSAFTSAHNLSHSAQLWHFPFFTIDSSVVSILSVLMSGASQILSVWTSMSVVVCWMRRDRAEEPMFSSGRSQLIRARCRADSAVECILMLDYLLYYCLPLLSLTPTLAYVGLCSLLSNLFSVDILPSLQEWLSSPSPSFHLVP